jgi:four helix bundle protein
MVDHNVGFKGLIAYQKAFELAMACFELSKAFPLEEKFDLTSQLRRSSRSVVAQIAEGYRKRNYPKYWVSKLIDADGENSETTIWLDFAEKCGYAGQEALAPLRALNDEVGRLVQYMIEHPEKFGAK